MYPLLFCSLSFSLIIFSVHLCASVLNICFINCEDEKNPAIQVEKNIYFIPSVLQTNLQMAAVRLACMSLPKKKIVQEGYILHYKRERTVSGGFINPFAVLM